ncbi:WD40-repeat-containing domain protein [Lipomyces tetrasporus]|uniref:Pre-rRNA-processing protein IPI3 n=1 Tax=Lipomyces tetrasporus TaxID=54092 RepID=A0AAD7QT69_9ASCO|nr:WD40-repeat-containing domain protein [Lipomyces tetrasporus]KAJ8100551.1 WD40-repeat-containing domain protein [Lipomyces tetrasporus]
MSDEYILYGTAASGSKADGLLAICKLNTSTPIRTFKQNGSYCNRIAVLDSRILSSQSDRPVIHSYSIKKEAPMQKLILQEKLSCIAASHSSKYLAAGTHSGKLILWELDSGACLIYKEIHYGSINCLVFSQDDSVLFSAGNDARIYSWRTLDLCNAHSNYNDIQPLATANQHSLEVTGLYCGYGGILDSRLYSISLDGSCRVWNASDLRLQTTFVFKEALLSVVVDPAERAIYAGCDNGVIYHVDLYRQPREGAGLLEYAGGLQRIVDVSSESTVKFAQHTDKILSLDLSFDGTLLVSGSQDGTVIVWDVSTHQVMKNIKPGRGPVYVVKVLENLPSEHYTRQESLGFAYNTTYASKNDVWIAVPESDESNVRFSISETALIGSEPIAFVDTGEEIPTINHGSSGSEYMQAKVEKLSAAYNALWQAYTTAVGISENGDYEDLATASK